MPQLTIVPEALCPQLVDEGLAFEAVSAAFAAMVEGKGRNFPVVREAIDHADALYGFKGGFDRASMTLGLKAGGYWPHNVARGIGNHQSTIFLFDPDTGCPTALVGANYITAMRTAAAAAVSIRHLAREDARVLGMIGAGHQSTFQMRAAMRQRRFEKVVGWNRHPERLSRLAEVASELGVPFEAVELDRLGAEADVIITITSSFAPILLERHVRPGTHIACMGTDTAGKQEIEQTLFAAATVFTDAVAQSVSIGEAQHAVASGLIPQAAIIPIGAVIAGLHPGRARPDEITIFDGTGISLQDLSVAAAAVERARAAGIAIEVQV